VIHRQASGNRQHRTGTARGRACCYPYMFRQSAKSAIPPAVMQCTARATEPETTGRQFAERLRVCWPVIACYSGLTAGRMPRGVFGAEPAGRIVAPVKRGTVTGTEADAPSGQLQAPGTIRPVTAPLTRPVVAASWHPATRQHYRGEFGTATPSAPLSAAKSGQIVAGIRPVIAASWRRDYVAQSAHQRVSAPRSQRVGAPLPAT
jgi:hypothetical protein